MNPARMRMIESNQTSIAKKVLSCVPIQEVWPRHRILSEINRSGSRIDPRIFEGCLESLVDSGLIKEPSRGSFQRIHIPNEEPKEVPAQPTAKTPAPSADAFAKLSTLASDLRKMADTIEEVALNMELLSQDTKEELEKLRTLKTLLKGL